MILNEEQLAKINAARREAGKREISPAIVHQSPNITDWFDFWVAFAHPDGDAPVNIDDEGAPPDAKLSADSDDASSDTQPSSSTTSGTD